MVICYEGLSFQFNSVMKTLVEYFHSSFVQYLAKLRFAIIHSNVIEIFYLFILFCQNNTRNLGRTLFQIRYKECNKK